MSKLGRVLLISDAFYLLSGGLLGPIYAFFVKEIGGDLLDASGAFGLFMLTASAVTFILASWEDKSKHQRKFVIAGYGIGVLGTLGYLFVGSPASLFIVQAVLGLSVALKDPAYDALFSQSSKKHLALAWGEWEALDYFVLGGGALLGGFIATHAGFKTLLMFMFGLSILSFVISLTLLRFKEKTYENNNRRRF